MSDNKPPQPPDIDRNIQFSPAQLAGTLLLLLLPVLALSGLFDVRMEVEKASGTGLELEVEYPTRLRFKQQADLKVLLRNTREDAVSDVIVRIDRSFIQSFSNVVIYPGVREIDDEDYLAEFGGIGSGDSKNITIELEPAEMGTIPGQVSVSGEGVEKFGVSFQAQILP